VLIVALGRYLALRRAAGFKLVWHERALSSYAEFAAARREKHIRVDSALEWVSQFALTRRRSLLSHVSGFARFLRVEDRRHQVPSPSLVAVAPRRRLPFVFSREQVRAVVGAAAQLCPIGGRRSRTYRMLFGLMAATGLRVGEALRLNVSDFADGGLTIRNTKFLKNRWIPLHSSMCVELDRYIRVRIRTRVKSERLFINYFRKPLSNHGAYKTFRRLCREVGVLCLDGKPPRLHDLRHTFAVRALERCKGDRFAIREHMVSLMTYLGHSSIENTYWYLHATPSLMKSVATATERRFGGGRP